MVVQLLIMEVSQFFPPVSYNVSVNHFTYPEAITCQYIAVIVTLNNYLLDRSLHRGYIKC